MRPSDDWTKWLKIEPGMELADTDEGSLTKGVISTL